MELNGAEFLLASKDACSINPDYQYTSDLLRLKQLLDVPAEQASREQLIEMKLILERELMEEFYIRDSNDFNDWLLFERTRYQRTCQQVLERLLDRYTAAGDLDGAHSTLEDLLRVSPYEEEYYYHIIQLCQDRGDRAAAIQYCRKCEEILQTDLNLPPSKRLRELHMKELIKVFIDASVSSAIIMFIMACAGAFTYILTTSGVASQLSNALLGITSNELILLLIMMLIL